MNDGAKLEKLFALVLKWSPFQLWLGIASKREQENKPGDAA